MSRAWYALCLVPIVICGAIALGLFASMISEVEGMPRFVIPGEKSLTLDPGEYTAFGESDSRLDGTHYVNTNLSVACTLTGPGGAPLHLGAPSANTKYNLGGYSGRSFYGFTIPARGTYQFACTGDSAKAVLAIGDGIGGAIVKALVMIFAGLISAGVAFGLVFVRRRRFAQLRTGS